MVSSVIVGLFPSKGDQRGLQGEKKSKEETRQNMGIISVRPHGGRQCSRLVTGKEILLECKCSARLQRGRTPTAKAWNGKGVDLLDHSDAQVSEIFKGEFLILHARRKSHVWHQGGVDAILPRYRLRAGCDVNGLPL
ncbi:hypothetical protein PIB30_059881 [Stylosanthes scabra]|uniref:Uncharacterized protein n=1 Tax=Stylosanthes scabra TaxID=79078 RepID=A0ABU6VIJ8_9FABA|nr:hypothetical protein [Stylosanthes scabra]